VNLSKVGQVVKTRLRVPKNESAFVYFILEAHEGVTAYSTLSMPDSVKNPTGPASSGFCYLELTTPESQMKECGEILASLGDLIHVTNQQRPDATHE
jgi:hypothetical protein